MTMEDDDQFNPGQAGQVHMDIRCNARNKMANTYSFRLKLSGAEHLKSTNKHEVTFLRSRWHASGPALATSRGIHEGQRATSARSWETSFQRASSHTYFYSYSLSVCLHFILCRLLPLPSVHRRVYRAQGTNDTFINTNPHS